MLTPARDMRAAIAGSASRSHRPGAPPSSLAGSHSCAAVDTRADRPGRRGGGARGAARGSARERRPRFPTGGRFFSGSAGRGGYTGRCGRGGLTGSPSARGGRAGFARTPKGMTYRAHVARGDSSPGGTNSGTDFCAESGQINVEGTGATLDITMPDGKLYKVHIK
jgi:hypothetical protein